MATARPCGVYNQGYDQELIVVRTKTQWALLFLGLIFLFTLPLYTSSTVLTLVNHIAVTLIAVYGLHILMGYCGQISIGQTAFVAVGAYVTAILTTELGFSFWAAFPCAVLSAGLAGVIFGLPALRIKGFYVAMATIAAQFIIPWIIAHVRTDITGGYSGISVPPITVMGNPLLGSESMFYVIIPVLLLAIYFSVNLRRSRIGRAFIAIRDNDLAAEAMGVNIFRYKLIAFFICSAYAGASGALWAQWLRALTPGTFTLEGSVFYLGMLVIGGLGSNAGVCFGTIFVMLINDLSRSFLAPALGSSLGMSSVSVASAVGPLFFGLIVLLFLKFEPRGLAHRWEQFKVSYRLNPFAN